MLITELKPFILHAPVTRGEISDSTHRITHWGAPGVAIYTDQGTIGYGFSGTHAHLPTDRLITECIVDAFGPLLIGKDPRETRAIWESLYHNSETQWVGRTGIVHLALGAIDIALWDLKAKNSGDPLWRLLGGSGTKRVEAYNTDGGWLNWTDQQLVDLCKELVEVEGYRAVKIKVGSSNLYHDLRRVESVRVALGPEIQVMVDANGRWTLPQAIEAGTRLADFQITWMEEPITYSDVQGHRRLADSVSVPIALGEQLYETHQFRDFIHANAVHYVQPDAVRLAGITEWWTVAELAHAHSLPVVPHIGDMGQVHQHLCIAHPACSLLEYIPWLQPWMKHPVLVEDGSIVVPDAPGAGTEPTPAALEQINAL